MPERLLAAIRSDSWQEVEQARKDHPGFPADGNDLLRLAAQAGAARVAFRLQSTGADPFGQDMKASAFQAALGSGQHRVAQQMLKCAASMNDGALPDLGPHLAFALDNDDQAAVSWLLKFALKQCPDMPFEVLRAAIDARNLRRIELLTGHPGLADAFADDAVERSILHHALRKGSADTVGFLLGSRPGRDRLAGLCAGGGILGCTALHYAVASRDPEKLDLILAAHAHARLGKKALDAPNAKGQSPLALALENGLFDMADRLLASGARPLAPTPAPSH